MSVTGLHEMLTVFGLTKTEAELYVFLTSMGPTPARVIARRFDINRVKAYRTLKELEDKGLVNRIMERPVRFMAQPIESVLQEKIEKTRGALEELETNKGRIISDIERLREVETSLPEEPRFRIYQGRQQIYELLANMCDRVEKEIRIVTTPSDFLRFGLWGIDARLAKLAQSGKKVSLLTEIDESIIDEVEEVQKDFEIRHLSVPSSVRFVTIDSGEALTSVAMDDSMSMTTQNDTGLWTNASGFTAAMQVFYDALWSGAPSSHVVVNSIRTGRPHQELVTIRSMEGYTDYFTLLLENAEKSIDIMVNRIQDLPVSLAEIMRTREEQKIRILTQVEESMSSELQEILSVADVRHNNNESKLTLLVADGRESLLTTTGTESSIQAVWSNLLDYVETTSMIFEDYWMNSRPADARYRELIAEQNKVEITETIVGSLLDDGWVVDSPGSVVGSTGVDHVFDILAENKSRVIGVNLILDGDGFNHVFELSSRKMDLVGIDLILGSIRGLEEEVVRLSSLYGINLIHGVDVNELALRIQSA
jgi:sugar-specific transcriptional regulator TrmB